MNTQDPVRQLKKNINNVIREFKPISLEEMDGIKLMNRSDTKFVFGLNELYQVLEAAKDYYSVLEINNKRILDYRTIYFDTEDLRFYMAHQNGKQNRYKIRQREYLDSDISFLEIKFKSNKGRTIKKRIPIDELEYELSDKSKKYIRKNMEIEPNQLSMALINGFSRITLADIERKERITVDLNLSYRKDDSSYELPFLVVAEIKQEGFSNGSAFLKILKTNSIHPSGMSKYCIGVISFNKDIKQNNFKPRLLKIKKVNDEFFVT